MINIMVIKEVAGFEQRFLDLVQIIDRGEHSLVVGGEKCDGFGGWVSKLVFEADNNYGMLSAFVYYGFLRFQLAFKNDVDVSMIEHIYECIKDLINRYASKQANIFCTNDNPKLIEGLRMKFNYEDELYMAKEYAYSRNQINSHIDITPLIVAPYSDDLLEHTLKLLDDSFIIFRTDSLSFLDKRDYYKDKFSQADKARFESFYLDDELIGFYFHNNAEIEYIAVLSKYQSNGYGSLVLKRALAMILEDSEREPHLYCLDRNIRANNFYEREGWKITGKPVKFQLINNDIDK